MVCERTEECGKAWPWNSFEMNGTARERRSLGSAETRFDEHWNGNVSKSKGKDEKCEVTATIFRMNLWRCKNGNQKNQDHFNG